MFLVLFGNSLAFALPGYNNFRLKAILLGGYSSGKTAFIKALIYSKIVDTTADSPHSDTVAGGFWRSVNFTQEDVDNGYVDNVNSSLQINIFDTAGEEKYFSLMPNYFRNADYIFLCAPLDVNLGKEKEKETYLTKWIEEIKKYVGEEAALIIVGTKSDKKEFYDKSIEVENKEILKKTAEINGGHFFICSAKDPNTLRNEFDRAVRRCFRAAEKGRSAEELNDRQIIEANVDLKKEYNKKVIEETKNNEVTEENKKKGKSCCRSM